MANRCRSLIGQLVRILTKREYSRQWSIVGLITVGVLWIRVPKTGQHT